MALCHLEHYFLKKSLYVEGVKFHRSWIFNKKEFLQYWQCSHYKTQKCKCNAVTKYDLVDIDKSMDTSSSSADSDSDGGCKVELITTKSSDICPPHNFPPALPWCGCQWSLGGPSSPWYGQNDWKGASSWSTFCLWTNKGTNLQWKSLRFLVLSEFCCE